MKTRNEMGLKYNFLDVLNVRGPSIRCFVLFMGYILTINKPNSRGCLVGVLPCVFFGNEECPKTQEPKHRNPGTQNLTFQFQASERIVGLTFWFVFILIVVETFQQQKTAERFRLIKGSPD